MECDGGRELVLRMSQPAASKMLKELETRLGVSLFVRKGGRISPTPEAGILLPEVENLLMQVTRLETRADEIKDARAGSLSIATIAIMTDTILPHAVRQFHSERPLVRLNVAALGTREILARVAVEGTDLGIVFAPVYEQRVAAAPILSTRMVCLMGADHRLAKRRVVRVKDLANQTLILLDPSAPPGPQLQEHLHEVAHQLAAVIEMNITFGAASIVRQGIGLLIADPLILLSPLATGLVVRPFEHAIPVTLLAAYPRRRPISRTAEHFINVLRQTSALVTRQLEQQGVYAKSH